MVTGLLSVQVLQVIHDRVNICRSIHLPAQSGSSRVLEAMRRGYTSDTYLALVEHIRDILPGKSANTLASNELNVKTTQ